MAGLTSASPFGSDSRRVGARTDGWLILATVILLIVGFMSLYSESASSSAPWFRKQVTNGVVGLVPFGLFFFLNLKSWRRQSALLYVANLALLAAVFLHGKSAKGAARWIPLGPVQFQPSELAKILVILTLAAFYTAHQDSITKPSTFFLGLLHISLPLGLILLQPHLGAALVIIVAWFAVSLMAGVPMKFLGLAAGVGILILGLILAVPSLSGKFLHGYQQGRAAGFLSTQKDVQGANWQTNRAEIAFGVGGVVGSGYMRGEQKAAGYIPEQQNDFIFTVVGEEGGLVGSSLVLLAFGFFFYRIWLVMVYARDVYSKMIAGGIFAVLAFHTFVNIAMVLQLLPVVGLWLPFLSYGGTALWLCLASVGLLLNIRRQERPVLFS